MAKAPQQTDALENEGPGVGKIKDRVLDRLADAWTDKRDQKAKLAEDMTADEAKIIERMVEKKISVYRYADREVRIDLGKAHVRIKTVKNEGVETSATDTAEIAE